MAPLNTTITLVVVEETGQEYFRLSGTYPNLSEHALGLVTGHFQTTMSTVDAMFNDPDNHHVTERKKFGVTVTMHVDGKPPVVVQKTDLNYSQMHAIEFAGIDDIVALCNEGFAHAASKGLKPLNSSVLKHLKHWQKK